MVHLEKLLINHFASVHISDKDLKAYAEDHLQRLTTADTDGVLAELIAPTGAAYEAYFGSISDKDVAVAVRQAYTVSVDQNLEEFKGAVSRKEGAIRSAFGTDSAAYQEFFPQGKTEYTHVTKENADVLMLRMKSATAKYAASLEPGMDALFATLYTNFTTARKAQLGQKGTVSSHTDAKHNNRTALELQLCANLHFIGYKYPGDAAKCCTFFRQELLYTPPSSGHSNTPPVTPVTG